MKPIITPENEHEFEHLPNGTFFRLFVPMICPDCSDIHAIPVNSNMVPKEGLVRLVEIVHEQLAEDGFRVPAEEDFKRAVEKMEAAERVQSEAEAAMQKAEEQAKARAPLFFMHRTPDPRGDA